MVTHTMIVPTILETQLTGRKPGLLCAKDQTTTNAESACYLLSDPPSCKRCLKKLRRLAEPFGMMVPVL